jgi:hypothetical protein
MKNLPALVAAGALAIVLGLVATFGLRAALTPSAEQAAAEISTEGDTAPLPLYGSR